VGRPELGVLAQRADPGHDRVAGLADRLAHLGRHRPGQIVGGRLHGRGGSMQRGATGAGRGAGPPGRGRASRLDRRGDVFLAGYGDHTDGLSVGRADHRQFVSRAARTPDAGDELRNLEHGHALAPWQRI
jgi:hypothetical protein